MRVAPLPPCQVLGPCGGERPWPALPIPSSAPLETTWGYTWASPRRLTGAVLAVSVPGDVRRGYWGEVLTVAAVSAGVTGLVIDATVRDIEAIERRQFPVFARGTAIPGAGKQGPGSVGKPVVIGDAVVRPGDWLVGDADGVVVVRDGDLEACLQAAAQRAEKESTMFQKLQAGSTTIELLGLGTASIEVAHPSHEPE